MSNDSVPEFAILYTISVNLVRFWVGQLFEIRTSGLGLFAERSLSLAIAKCCSANLQGMRLACVK